MGRLTFDDCDDCYDVNHRFSTSSKRKRLLRGNSEPKTHSHNLEKVVEKFKLGGRIVDEDYMYFLRCVFEGNELRWLAEGEESSDVESDDDIDPDCKVFIDNLLEDGKSYLLRIVNYDRTEEFIKYEAEDESDEECASESSGELQHSKKAESREVRKDFRNVKSADKAEKAGKERRDGECGSPSRRELRSDKKGKKIRVKKDFCNSRSTGEDEKARKERDEDCGLRSQRELRSFKKGKNIAIEKDFRNVPSTGKGENTGKERDEVCCPLSWRELRSDKKGSKIGGKKDLRTVENGDQVEKQKNVGSTEKHLRCEPSSHVSHGINGCLSRQPSLLREHAPAPQREYNLADDTVDSSYRWFLKNMQKEGDHFVLVRSDGKRIVYEEDDQESSSDSEVLMMDNDPYCCKGDNTPFVHSRVFDASTQTVDQPCIGNPTKHEHSQFRENLMGILQRPYNQEELEKLWQEVKEQKPMEGRRNLRGAIISFRKDEYSKSYLDHYKGKHPV
ncbi:hypothetical protein RJ639_005288 [Escallonia herrerae]|uniref:Uncharacterized protein n=1 Tax=Escallonia herrerae TaxID=1293975 RepID=A0AA88VY11_9ASTE|nr:hypothetical protein RJ639_005288 [Escallonia herrerae]